MAAPARPLTVQDYLPWAVANLGVDFGAAPIRNRYETNLQSVLNAVQGSRFIRDLPPFLTGQEEGCVRATGSPLLMTSELVVRRKPFDSSVVKSFRVNVLKNQRFPNPPADGWVTPDNWYTRFDDLVRGILVCKFIDGPKLLAGALDGYATGIGLSARHVPRSTDDGYYAFHHYTRFPVEIVDAGWQTQAIAVELEIQLTTQLQEVLRELTHPLYEKARIAAGRRDDAWKWDYDSPRFGTSYLGHTLHMIEAIIVQVRDRARTQAAAVAAAGPPPIVEPPAAAPLAVRGDDGAAPAQDPAAPAEPAPPPVVEEGPRDGLNE